MQNFRSLARVGYFINFKFYLYSPFGCGLLATFIMYIKMIKTASYLNNLFCKLKNYTFFIKQL